MVGQFSYFWSKSGVDFIAMKGRGASRRKHNPPHSHPRIVRTLLSFVPLSCSQLGSPSVAPRSVLSLRFRTIWFASRLTIPRPFALLQNDHTYCGFFKTALTRTFSENVSFPFFAHRGAELSSSRARKSFMSGGKSFPGGGVWWLILVNSLAKSTPQGGCDLSLEFTATE